MSDYLFPIRRTRRDFLAASAAGAAGIAGAVALSSFAAAQDAAPPVKGAAEQSEVRIGEGKHTFVLDREWGKLPAGMKYGLGCAIVVDGQDRIWVTSRSTQPCVAIFGREGELLETWSDDFARRVGLESPQQVAATAHGLYWSKESEGEFLYWTENVAGGSSGGKKLGARVYKTDLDGKVLYTLGNVEQEGPTSQKLDLKNPTDVAVSPSGDIYVVDGYGSQKVHRFDKNFKLLKTIGGPGKEHGQFNTCHGVWISTLRDEPEVYIADRANDRIEIYSPELEYKRTIAGLRKPCCFYQHDGLIYVPELAARVSILDADDQFVAHLGDGAGIKPADIDQHPGKFATPHALTLDSAGDLYLLEWLPHGRVRKFRRG